jgi:rhamnogalacturonan endolyase
VPCLLEDHQYRMAVAWQNASYNQPPHLSYSLAESLGIDRATYKTNVTSTAPDATPVEPASGGEETVKIPAADKGTIVGTCYTAGENGELTASEKDGYIKMRTGNNGNTITITVNEGYVVTGIYIEGYSNNTSTAADRSITMTGVYVDGSTNSEIASSVVFPGGTAGQNPVSANVTGFEASKNIVLKFDNSNIVSSEEDSAGKNKQLFAKIVLTYKKADASGISSVKTWQESSGQTFDLQGRRVDRMSRGIYIKDGRKIAK